MPSLIQYRLDQLEKQKQIASSPQPSVAMPPRYSALKQSEQDQQELTLMLMQCFQAQKLYGKEPEQIEGVIAMFRMVLADYPIEEIRKAFVKYLKTNSDMPAPADIAMIINPPSPTPDWAAYVGIKSKIKDGKYIMQRERDYLTWCEEKAISKPLEWKNKIAELEKRMMKSGE